MKHSKIALMGAGVAYAALLLAPKAAHAVTAALVQVANTSANPVPNLDTERNARIPYEVAISLSSCGSTSPIKQCAGLFPAPPAGYRLVVENVSGTLYLASIMTPPPFAVLSVWRAATARVASWSFPATMGPTTSSSLHAAVFNLPALAVVDTDDQLSATVAADWYPGAVSTVTVSGYLQNCSVSACPAVTDH